MSTPYTPLGRKKSKHVLESKQLYNFDELWLLLGIRNTSLGRIQDPLNTLSEWKNTTISGFLNVCSVDPIVPGIQAFYPKIHTG